MISCELCIELVCTPRMIRPEEYRHVVRKQVVRLLSLNVNWFAGQEKGVFHDAVSTEPKKPNPFPFPFEWNVGAGAIEQAFKSRWLLYPHALKLGRTCRYNPGSRRKQRID